MYYLLGMPKKKKKKTLKTILVAIVQLNGPKFFNYFMQDNYIVEICHTV
jgi:hypothetical protein